MGYCSSMIIDENQLSSENSISNTAKFKITKTIPPQQ